MGFFNRRFKPEPLQEVAEFVPPVFNIQAVVPEEVAVATPNLRPCWVKGRRALFHRWVNNAHPVLPRGAERTDSNRHFQFRRTEALVEYEDGTVERVWPTVVQFADGGAFKDHTWLPMEEIDEEEQDGTE